MLCLFTPLCPNQVACNLRGYSPGASPPNVGDYEWDTALEADAWAIADAVNFTAFHIVSHDMGASTYRSSETCFLAHEGACAYLVDHNCMQCWHGEWEVGHSIKTVF